MDKFLMDYLSLCWNSLVIVTPNKNCNFFVNAQIILEGMGRALHTNLNARFKCDALKVRWFYQIFVFLLVETIFLFFVGNLIDGDIGTCFHSWR